MTTKSWIVFALVANLSASEAIRVEQAPQSLTQSKWAIPCKNSLCIKMMQSLNPRNDWVHDKYDQLDNENDDEFWDPKKNVQHLHQHGSDQYGHVTSKVSGVVGLHQQQARKNNGGKHKKKRFSSKKFKDDAEDSPDEDPKEKHDKPKRLGLKKKKEKKLEKKVFDSDEDEESKEIRSDIKAEEEYKEKKAIDKDHGIPSSGESNLSSSDHDSDSGEEKLSKKKTREDRKMKKKDGKKKKSKKSKSKERVKKDADRKGNLKHNTKAEDLHKIKSVEQDDFDKKEEGHFNSDDEKVEKKHGVMATLQDANMAIKGVKRVSGEIEKEQHRGMKAADFQQKKSNKKSEEDEGSDMGDDLAKNIQKANKKNLKDAEKMRNKTSKADYSVHAEKKDKEEKEDDDSKEVKSIGEKLKELKLADKGIKNDLESGASKGEKKLNSEPEDESELQVAEKLIKKIHLKAQTTESLIKKDLDKIHEKVQKGYEPEWGHNSGSSYDNGPNDHFYAGKASPYSVTGQDVQLTNPVFNTFAEIPRPTTSGTSLVQQLGIDKDSLRKNVEYYELKGKLIQTSKFKSNSLTVPSVDSMMDENADVKTLEQDLKYNFGI